MAEKIKLSVKPRKVTGRKVKQLRRQGIIPGNLYGREVKSLAVEVAGKDLKEVYQKVGETTVIELAVDKEAKPRPVLIHNLQLHPVSEAYLHVDFHQVDLTKKVTVTVPIEIVGEAPAVAKGGVLVQLLNDLEVEALPTDLPEKLVVDVTKLSEIGQGITIAEINVDKTKVKLLAEKQDELVVKIEEPAKEEEEEKPVEVPAEAAPAAAAEEKKEEEKETQPKAGQPMADKKAEAAEKK